MKRLSNKKILEYFNNDLNFRRIYSFQTLCRYFYNNNLNLYEEDKVKFYKELALFLIEEGISQDLILADNYEIAVFLDCENKKLMTSHKGCLFSVTHHDFEIEHEKKTELDSILKGEYGVDYWFGSELCGG